MKKLHHVTAVGLGLSALLLAGCGGTAEAEPLPADEAGVASVISSGPSNLEREKEAEATAAVEAARLAAEAEAARVATEQAAAEAARIAAEEAARDAARIAAEQAARKAVPRPSAPQQSTRPAGTQAAPEPGAPAAPAPAPAPAPEQSNVANAANFRGVTLLSCNADNTIMTIRVNFTSGSYTAEAPNGTTGMKLPSGEWVDVRVECGM